MPPRMQGSVGELRFARTRLRDLRELVAGLATANYAAMAGVVKADADALADTRFWVAVSCLVCGRRIPVGTLVGDPERTEPAAVICGPCDKIVDNKIRNAKEDEPS